MLAPLRMTCSAGVALLHLYLFIRGSFNWRERNFGDVLPPCCPATLPTPCPPPPRGSLLSLVPRSPRGTLARSHRQGLRPQACAGQAVGSVLHPPQNRGNGLRNGIEQRAVKKNQCPDVDRNSPFSLSILASPLSVK